MFPTILWKEKMEELNRRHIEILRDEDDMDYAGYYNGYDLLLRNDLSGNMPAIFLCVGNKTAGKTFFFKRFVFRLFLKFGSKVLIICRKKTQIRAVGYSWIASLEQCFKGQFGFGKTDSAGVKSLSYNGIDFAYITYYNYANDLKESSNMFENVNVILKDEFQSETGEYCEEEVRKLRIIHKCVSRGFGKRNRFVPVILISNVISIVNPYYLSLGIHKVLRPDTKNLRGEGWVLQITLNKEAQSFGMESSFDKAFGMDETFESAINNKYLDNLSFCVRLNTNKMSLQFIFTIKGKSYGVWYDGLYYVSTRYDPNCRRRYAADLKSHMENTIMIRKSDPVFKTLKEYFERGYFRFENVECRTSFIELLAISNF